MAVQSKDFVGSIPGFGQYFKCGDNRHGKVVMPASLVISESVDTARRNEQIEQNMNQGTCVDPQLERINEEEYIKGVLNTAVVDCEQQARILREIEKTQKEKKNSSQSRPDVNPQDHYEMIPGLAASSTLPPHQQPPPHPPGSHGHVSSSTSASSANRTRREMLKIRDHRSSVQDENLLGYHPGGSGSNIPLHHQRSMPNSIDEHHHLVQHPDIAQQSHQFDQTNQPLYHNIPTGTGGPQQPYEQQNQHHGDNYHQNQHGVAQVPQPPHHTQQGAPQGTAPPSYSDNQYNAALTQGVSTGAVAVSYTHLTLPTIYSV